jgi:hypothetical protein
MKLYQKIIPVTTIIICILISLSWVMTNGTSNTNGVTNKYPPLSPVSSLSSSSNSSIQSSTVVQSVQSQNSSSKDSAQIYSNQYFPDLKIKYGSDWKFSRIVKNSKFTSLVETNISLTKGNQKLNIEIAPLDVNMYTQKYGPSYNLNNTKNLIKAEDKTIVSPDYFRRIWNNDPTKIDPRDKTKQKALIKTIQERAPGNAFEYEFRRADEDNQEKFEKNLGKNYMSYVHPIITSNIQVTDVLNQNYSHQDLLKLYPTKQGQVLFTLRIEYQGETSSFGEVDQIIKDSQFPFTKS